jgi:hypothetical protein
METPPSGKVHGLLGKSLYSNASPAILNSKYSTGKKTKPLSQGKRISESARNEDLNCGSGVKTPGKIFKFDRNVSSS